MTLRYRRVVVARQFVFESLDVLQRAGLDGLEALVLWLARSERTDYAVTRCWVPLQRSEQSRLGLHLRVDAPELERLDQELYRTGETLIAQVHSHPTLPYHSDLDDARPVVTEVGCLSLVVPYLGFATAADLASWAVYRLQPDGFQRMNPTEINAVIQLR
jgi:hypothetical protein